MKKDKDFSISATAIKEFKSCTLKYFYNRIQKVPQDTNQGAICGSVVHEVFELLFVEKRREILYRLADEKSFKNFPQISRLIKALMRKHGADDGNFDLICDFFWAGIGVDVLSRGGDILGIEHDFLIKNENPRYVIKGYIDLLIKYPKVIEAFDWKSQKNKFSEAEMGWNIQGLMYALAMSKDFPELEPITNFALLRFGEIQECKPSREDLIKFEYELAEIYEKMVNFSYENRLDNIAAKQNYPSDGSFGGPLQCGRSKVKGELKNDGSIKYACPFKHPTVYYKLCDEDGGIIKSAFAKEELEKDFKEGYFILEAKHPGCEHFYKLK